MLSEYALDQLPALSENLTYTVFGPSPEERVHFLEVEYRSGVDQVMLSLENCICEAWRNESLEDRVSVTSVAAV